MSIQHRKTEKHTETASKVLDIYHVIYYMNAAVWRILNIICIIVETHAPHVTSEELNAA
jgi:hypothetical protein